MKKAVSIIVNILAWLILIFALLVTIVVFSSGKNNGVANIFGYIPLTVQSDSMLPTFAKNDLIICKEVDDINNLQKDDVITFWTMIDGKKAMNTHRIVEINDNEGRVSFITRGDNNEIDDFSPVSSEEIIGKWTKTKISGFGKAMDFLRTKKGFFICILIPMALFFLFELYKFILTLVQLKQPEPVEQLDEEEIKRRAIEEYLASQKQSGDDPGAAKAVEEKAAEAKETAEEAVNETKETVAEAVDDAKETAEEAVDKAKEAVAEAVDEAKEAAEEAVDEAKETVEEKAAEAEEAAEEIVNEAKETVEETTNEANDAAEAASSEATNETADPENKEE